jgi:hypothetical protein
MREILRNAYHVIQVDDERRLVRRARTERSFASVAEVERYFEEVLQAGEPRDRRRYALLVDARLAPPRNDPVFEQIFERYRERLHEGYRRIALLTRTEVGKLHVSRLSGCDARAFVDEAAALAYLLDPEPLSRRP